MLVPLFIHSTLESAHAQVRFHCPACGMRDVSGPAWTEHQFTRLLGIVPVLEERLHWARCTCCERQLLSRAPPETLAGLDADTIEVQRLLVDRVSPVKLALLLAAFLTCCVPVSGPLFLLLAWLPRGSSRPWFRVACWICLLLHLALMNILVISAILGERR